MHLVEHLARGKPGDFSGIPVRYSTDTGHMISN